MAGTLERLALEVKNAPMRERLTQRIALQNHVRGLTEMQLVREIEMIENPDVAGQIVGAGIGARAQNALADQVRKLRGA